MKTTLEECLPSRRLQSAVVLFKPGVVEYISVEEHKKLQ